MEHLAGFHGVAVEGAAAVSVIFVALVLPDLSGTVLLTIGGMGATLCGVLGIRVLFDSKTPEA